MRIEIKDMKVGDVVWEKHYKLTIISGPVRIEKSESTYAGWKATATCEERTINLFVSDIAPHYGPKFHTENPYA